jgi:Holliday junction resolvasome RuvABC endonuclease subunit
VKILGLDLSLTSTGYSLNGETGIISTKERGAQRLSTVTQQIVDFCSNNGIDCAVIEGYSFASRHSQAHSIGELGGCVRMRLWEEGVPFIDVPPTSRAKFATGKGNAGKTEVISAISSKTGKVFSGGGADDECDAWVLEQMGLARINLSQFQWTKEQLSALDKVDWAPLENLVKEKNEKLTY